MLYYLGTSGWSYDHWVGEFYPEDLPRNKWLEFFTKHFNTAEVNMTFYRFPFENLLKGWYNKTPSGFKFSLKANRQITHEKKFKNVSQLLKKFYKLADILQEKLGCILFQTPPSFKLEKDYSTFKRFLEVLYAKYSSYRNVIEFRHPSWYCEKAFELLKQHNIGFCIVSAPKLPEIVKVTARHAYFRFHGAKKWYSYDYSAKELKEWANKIRKIKAKECFIYFNNDFNAYAVKNCKQLKKLLKQK